MRQIINAQTRKYDFVFHSFRNITSPEDKDHNRTIYTGQAPLSSILDLPTDENVRSYLVDAEGKKRKAYTTVHKAIKDTLTTDSQKFSVLNSGIVLISQRVDVDEKDKKLVLYNPSIINGSQTQGVIKDLAAKDLLPLDTHIKFEIIISDDDELVAEISIARNFQNDVMSISIAGRRKQFDELESSFKNAFPSKSLRKSESEYTNDLIVDTEKLLQVITALIPKELWMKHGEGEEPNKVYTYSQKSRCLKEFQQIYEAVKKADINNKDLEKYQNLYKYYLDIAPDAYSLYYKWKAHQGFKGTGLSKGIVRDSKNNIVELPDGLIFPIIASLSEFVVNVDGKWTLEVPSNIDSKLIATAKNAMIDIAKHNPQSMGKNKACYSSLLIVTSLYKELTQ